MADLDPGRDVKAVHSITSYLNASCLSSPPENEIDEQVNYLRSVCHVQESSYNTV